MASRLSGLFCALITCSSEHYRAAQTMVFFPRAVKEPQIPRISSALWYFCSIKPATPLHDAQFGGSFAFWRVFARFEGDEGGKGGIAVNREIRACRS